MDKNASWEKIRGSLLGEKDFKLQQGKPFKAIFDNEYNEIIIIPTETGIQRRIGMEEWDKFVDKFNEIESGPYGHLKFKPGHYSRITFNSSYLVTIAKNLQL